jgi:hypothetical protein
MARTAQVTAYLFNELNDEAKEVARQWYREGIDLEMWSHPVEDAAQVGIKITGYDIGRGNDIDGSIADTEDTAHAIVREHGEGCDTHKTAAAYLAERDAIIEAAPKDEAGEFVDEYELDEKLNEAGAEFTRAILEDYLQMLRNEYEHAHSDEQVDESIEANGYEFDEHGNRFQY